MTAPDSPMPRLQAQGPFAVTLLLLACLYLTGGLMGYIGRGSLFGIPAGPFMALYACSWLVWLAALITFPRGLSTRTSMVLILAAALACRIFLLPHAASDDVSRYLWEGRLVTYGISPYHHPPDDPALNWLAGSDPYHARINHPDIPAAYPPGVLLIFAATGLFHYGPMAVKTIVIFFDLATVMLLFALLRHRELDLRWSILYALNPVILYGFAGQAHFDALQNFFLTAALVFYDRKRWGWMFLAAGLAIQMKYVAALAVPFLIRRDNWLYLWPGLAAVVLLSLPFVQEGAAGILTGLKTFSHQYAFNGPVHGLLRAATGGFSQATSICKALLTLVLLLGYGYFHPQFNKRCENDPASGCFFVFGALVLLSPTVHFWYLSWIIPLLVLRPTLSWIVLCLSTAGYFVAVGMLHQTGKWHLPGGVQMLEWLPFWLLLANDARLFYHRTRTPVDDHTAESISVIIPTHNEEHRITACIDAILSTKNNFCEVIVVDGGSSDSTLMRARQAGARVLTHDCRAEDGGGRGGQINAGLTAAEGDVVAIVHADTVVDAAVLERICRILQRQPMIIGGSVGAVFDSRRWPLRLLEYLNDLRAAFFAVSYGDQVQFFRRRPVVRQSVFPNIPLMEDVELGIRLHHLGRQTFLFGGAVVSPRRWLSAGSKNLSLTLSLMRQYLFGRLWHQPDTLSMYRRYYGSPGSRTAHRNGGNGR